VRVGVGVQLLGDLVGQHVDLARSTPAERASSLAARTRAEARKGRTTLRGEPLIPLSANEIRRLPNEQRQASVEQRPV
jgi:hypothetical protein